MKNSKKLLLLALLSTLLTNLNLICMDNLSPKIIENQKLTLIQNQTLEMPLVLKGTCIIDGNGSNLYFAYNASITVAQDSTLCLKNITIKDIGQKIRLTSNTSKILIAENVTWEIKDYFIFDLGSFTVQNSTFTILGENPIQKAFFFYKTPEKSTINTNSLLKMENVFFIYSPNNQKEDFKKNNDLIKTNNLIETSNKSTIYFKNSTILLKQNLQLLRCWIIVDETLKLMAEKECALTLGDGVLKENNAPIDLYPTSKIEDTLGYTYNIEELYYNEKYHTQELHINNVK